MSLTYATNGTSFVPSTQIVLLHRPNTSKPASWFNAAVSTSPTTPNHVGSYTRRLASVKPTSFILAAVDVFPLQGSQSADHALPRAGILTYFVSPPPPYVPRSSAELPAYVPYPTGMLTSSMMQKTLNKTSNGDAKKVRFAVEEMGEDDELNGMLEEGDIVVGERHYTSGRERLARCRTEHESGGWLERCTLGEKVLYVLMVLSAVMNAVAIFGPWGSESSLREVKFCLVDQMETYPGAQLWRIANEEDGWACEESITLLAVADEDGEVDMEYQGMLPSKGWADNQ